MDDATSENGVYLVSSRNLTRTCVKYSLLSTFTLVFYTPQDKSDQTQKSIFIDSILYDTSRRTKGCKKSAARQHDAGMICNAKERSGVRAQDALNCPQAPAGTESRSRGIMCGEEKSHKREALPYSPAATYMTTVYIHTPHNPSCDTDYICQGFLSAFFLALATQRKKKRGGTASRTEWTTQHSRQKKDKTPHPAGGASKK